MLFVADDFALLAAKLNNVVHAHSDSHSFISFFAGLLRSDSGELTYVNAGHNPPLLLGPEDKIQSLDGTGMCLGMFPGVSYQTRTVEIEPGAILCLFTDGIVEQRNRYGEEYGHDRLIRHLCDPAGYSSKDIVKRIFEDVFCFAGGMELNDDLTLVVVRRKAP